MPKIKVTLSIGFIVGNHEDIIDIDDDEWGSCKTDEERDKLCEEYWSEWSNNYIDGSWKLLE